MLHPDPASPEPLSLEMTLTSNGQPGPRSTLYQASGLHSAVPYLAKIGSSEFPPGDYEVKAVLTQGGVTSTQSRNFHVGGAHAAKSAPATITAVGDEEIPARHGARPASPTCSCCETGNHKLSRFSTCWSRGSSRTPGERSSARSRVPPGFAELRLHRDDPPVGRSRWNRRLETGRYSCGRSTVSRTL